jgi:hypothetical protein
MKAQSNKLQSELFEKFQFCTFHPQTVQIHKQLKHLKQRSNVAQYAVRAKRDACEELYELSVSKSGKRTAVEAFQEHQQRVADEARTRSAKASHAKAAAVHLRLFEEASARREQQQQAALEHAASGTAQIVSYVIKNQLYASTPPTHADPSSFERLHSEGASREAAHQALILRYRPPFAPAITPYASDLHSGRSEDAFARLSAAANKAGSSGVLAPSPSSLFVTLPPAVAGLQLTRSLGSLDRHPSRVVSREHSRPGTPPLPGEKLLSPLTSEDLALPGGAQNVPPSLCIH